MKLSLCITCYDLDCKKLPRLLKEFEHQTIRPDETIVVCSGMKYLAARTSLSNFNIHCIPDRLNAAQARNCGFEKASNDYIMFFDVDDRPHPQKIEATHLFMGEFDFLLHSFVKKQFDRSLVDLRLIHKYTDLRLPESETTNIDGPDDINIHHAHITVKKSVFPKVMFNETDEFAGSEDGKFCQDLIRKNYKGLLVDFPFVWYR